MSHQCVKAISEHGSKLNRLVYGVGALVHRAICDQQKRGKLAARKSVITVARRL